MTAESPSSGRTTQPGSDIEPAALLGEQHEEFERVLTGDLPGPLAVVGDPFGGREAVLAAAATQLDAQRLRLSPSTDVDAVLAELDEGPVVISDCQHLYARTIDGFEPLMRFLDRLGHVDGPVVAGWNRYAWTYLAATKDIEREFPVSVELASVSAQDLADLILARYGEMPAFRPDDPDTGGLLALRRYSVGWRELTVSVPVPVPNLHAIRVRRTHDDVDPKDVVFERLATLSDNNVGVATAIWESHRSAEIRPSDIAAPKSDLQLDREEAFCLRILLAKEAVTRKELADIVGDGLDRIMGRFVRADLVDIEDDVVSLRPEAVPAAAGGVERRPMI